MDVVKVSVARGGVIFGSSAGAIALGCRNDMRDQPRSEPLESSRFFPDGLASRAPVPGTVARGQLGEDRHFETGMVDGKLATTFPRPITAGTLARGRERFEIFCTPCHGPEGKGGVTGPVAVRFIPAPDLTNAALQQARTDGYWHSYIVAGGAVMPSYGEALSSEEAWHIVNYLRTLAQR